MKNHNHFWPKRTNLVQLGRQTGMLVHAHAEERQRAGVTTTPVSFEQPFPARSFWQDLGWTRLTLRPNRSVRGAVRVALA